MTEREHDEDTYELRHYVDVLRRRKFSILAPMLILFVIFQKQIMESIKTSGLK